MNRKYSAPLLTTLFALVPLSALSQAKLPAVKLPPVEFNRDVRPILADNCFTCHGFDRNKRQANLRLDTPEGAFAPAASGKPVLVAGKPAESELVRRLTVKGPLHMPPVSTGKALTPKQIETLKRWVAQGAKYQPHWAWIPPKRTAPPKVANAAWAKNPVDAFLLARMEREGLKPAPPADRRTLLRRLSLDLTGLPPTPADLRAFLADSSPNAYEKAVDRLLASPHYGERMGVYWLDLVRYADTAGYHGDQEMSVWPYRDYVIRAFNANKRFDAFTREQLAGDLLPNRTTEQLVASGYNRLGMMTAEGGAQDKEYRAKYAADRVRNASAAWLGATMGCAECHDHKYDPFTAKDFYRFAAFFADLKEKGFYPDAYTRGDWGPSLRLPSPEQKTRLDRLEADIAAAKKALDAAPDAQLAAGQAQWETKIRELDAAKALAWTFPKPISAISSGGSTVTVNPDGAVFASGKLPAFDTYTVTLPSDRDRIAAIRFEAQGDDSLPGQYVSRSGYYFVIGEFEVAVQRGNGPLSPVKLASVTVSGDDEGFPGGAMLDGKPNTGWAIVNAHTGYRAAAFRFAEPVQGGPDVKLVVRVRNDAKPYLHPGKFRLSSSGVEGAGVAGQGVPDNVLTALRKEPSQRTIEEAALITAHYRTTIAPELAEARTRLARLETERGVLLGEIPRTLVSEVTDTPRVVRVLARGNWMDDTGEIVKPGVPAFLRQVKADGASRLDLANWIVSPENPLTARVFANRLWKMFFGVGLSKVLEDVGGQGEPPVHPELLDWLATEFEKDWDVKRLVRLIVTSQAYRQSSRATSKGLAHDPYNRFYARQSAIRLDAEFVRDTALRVSGLLSERQSGPSVYPAGPRGYLAALNFPRRDYAPDVGGDLYRRGLYTHWQRTFLHPSLLAFDAPSREEATCTRTVSNTPMQALVLLNDPIYVEAAQAFARRILREGGATFDTRLRFAFETALSRVPEPKEAALLRRLFDRQCTRYAGDATAAKELIGDAPAPDGVNPAELAAWVSVARTLLNLHEAITRG